jgi:murein DD-endopeptidase MepM/ murein hydrolase activator NlpD
LAGVVAAGMATNYLLSKTGEIAKNIAEPPSTVTEDEYNKEDKALKEEKPIQAAVPASAGAKAEDGTDKTEQAGEEAEKEKEEPFALAAPLNGKIMVPFSGDSLIFSETMQDFRKHGGVDIKSAILEKVRSAEAGVIKEIKTDRSLGITIVIDHENGFESVYANLSTAEMVRAGDRVEKGVIISGVGDTASTETGEEAHLHFELLKDGKAVNPEDYIAF